MNASYVVHTCNPSTWRGENKACREASISGREGPSSPSGDLRVQVHPLLKPCSLGAFCRTHSRGTPNVGDAEFVRWTAETHVPLACATRICRTGRLTTLLSEQQEVRVSQAQQDAEQGTSATPISESRRLEGTAGAGAVEGVEDGDPQEGLQAMPRMKTGLLLPVLIQPHNLRRDSAGHPAP